MIYQNFAKVYEHLMPHEMYHDWLSYTQHMLGPLKGQTLLDLGCGAGDFIQIAQQAGAIVSGVDISAKMLELAAQKVNVPLYLRSMIDLQGLPPASIVTSYCDSVCYLTGELEWLHLFQSVFQFLPSEGWFLFDVHSLETLSNFEDFLYRDQLEDGTDLIWESEVYGEANRLKVIHHLTIYQPAYEIDDVHQRFVKQNEQHQEVTYAIDQIINWLKAAGFNQIIPTSQFGLAEATDWSERLFFACRKN